MSSSNISEFKPRTQSYEFEFLGKKTTLSFDERYLHEEWKKGVAKGKSTYLLYRLSPNIVEATDINQEALKLVRTSWILLIASIVIYFSDYKETIPLLAPVLAVAAISIFTINIRKSWPRVWAIVYDDYNYKQVGIPLSEKDEKKASSERGIFLNELSEAIEVARKQEFYGDK